MYKNVIIWGHPLHSHTHSYIHNAFYRAFRALGFKTYWFDNTEINGANAENINDAIYLTEGQVDKFIPIKKNCAYITHNCSSPKYTDVKRIGIQVGTFKNEKLATLEKISPLTYYDINSRLLYIAWATDLLPEEFDFEILKTPKEDKVYWVGTIAKCGLFENFSVIKLFQDDCSANNIEFVHLCKVSLETNIEAIRKSYISPTIVGKWQREVGFIPCRIFKNISYGELGITNSLDIRDALGDFILYEPNARNLIEASREERLNKERIIEGMRYVQKYHTYINRINDILKVL